MSVALLFHYLLLNMFWMLIHPSSGACDLFDELFHGLYCSGSMCVGVMLWFGWGGVVSICRLKQCFSLRTDTTPAVNNEIIKQVTSSWSLFIQLSVYVQDPLVIGKRGCTGRDLNEEMLTADNGQE